MPEYARMFKTIANPHPEKKVAKMDVSVIMDSTEGIINITDFMFQDGIFMTGWEHNTQEMLQPWTTTPKKHYNALVRGEKALYIPNSGDTMGYADWTITADTNLPRPKSVENEFRGRYSLEFGNLYRTRNIRIRGDISAGDVFKFWGEDEVILKNDARFTKYTGFFLGAPAGDMYFLVSVPGEQAPWDDYDINSRPVAEPEVASRVRAFISIRPRSLTEEGKAL